MLFRYEALDKEGGKREGGIEAVNIEAAINSLQKRGFVITSIKPEDEKKDISDKIPFINRVSSRDVVILSRQIATLFKARVSALQVFRLLAAEAENPRLQNALDEIGNDVQGGSTISKAMAKHPNIFSNFYTNMVAAGEESGQLDNTFEHLASYLDRSYELTSKARNALVYPAFVITVFIGVMALMFTVVIPKISVILVDSGQELPIYTKIVIFISDFFVNWWFVLIISLLAAIFAWWKWKNTEKGAFNWDKFKLAIPYLGTLYYKLYLARIADNMNTMISSGISMVRSIEITASVVNSPVFEKILFDALEDVKGGAPLSGPLSERDEVPGIMVQMIRVGEETGELGTVLETLGTFYSREVENAVETLVALIEPLMIVVLGVGVGILLAAVLMPIYNLSAAF